MSRREPVLAALPGPIPSDMLPTSRARLISTFRRLVALLLVLPVADAAALAQQQAPPSAFVPYEHDSGWQRSDSVRRDAVISFPVHLEGATWMRLHFEDLELAGNLARGEGAILRMTALADGAIQEMDARHVRQWGETSAYFNGDTVLVEVIAEPNSGWSRASVRGVEMGLGTIVEPSICGVTDDRLPSSDPYTARIMPIGCTGWLIDDCKQCFLTAGHCTGNISVAQFNVPLSNGGNIQHPGPEDQYAIDAVSVQSNGGVGGAGDDWAYFGAFSNSITGLTPAEGQGGTFVLASPPSPAGNDIRITGYGLDSSPSDWNQVQQTHVGPMVTRSGSLLEYATDTEGGNSGSPVIWEQTGQAIGIHGHGGCFSTGGENAGTSITHSQLQAALADPKGICAPGVEVSIVGEVLPGVSIDVLADVQGGGLWSGTIPAPSCGQTPDFWVSFQEPSCGSVTDPPNAPSETHSLDVGVPQATFEDDFQADQGWTTASAASTGDWERGVPVNDSGWSYDPLADSDGSGSCFLTQNQPGNSDVDGGSVSLISPILDLSVADVFVTYDYFLYLTVEDGDDRLLVEARNGGGPWQTVDVHTTSGGLAWRSNRLEGADFTGAGVTLSNDVQLRFTANDDGSASIVEAGLDAVFVGRMDCGESPGTSYCTPGANGATITAVGSASVAANDLSLLATGALPSVNGIFFYGDLRATTPLGNGTLCVAGSAGIFRLPPVLSSNAAGEASRAIDLASPPSPAGTITAGSTWNFQLWFRDGGSSDLTDAVEVQFTP